MTTFVACAFGLISKKSLPRQGTFSLYFLLGALHFQVLNPKDYFISVLFLFSFVSPVNFCEWY